MRFVKTLAILLVIVAIFGGLMFALNLHTGPIIEENKLGAIKDKLNMAMPDAESYKELTAELKDLPESVVAVYEETSGKGFVVICTATSQYTQSEPMEIVVAVDTTGKISGIALLSHSESLIFGDGYPATYIGADSTLFGVEVYAGSTYSSNAFKGAVADAMNALISNNLIKAGEKSPEQILTELIATVNPDMVVDGVIQANKMDVSGDITVAYKSTNDTGYAYIMVDGGASYLIIIDANGEGKVYDVDGQDVTASKTALVEATIAHIESSKLSALKAVMPEGEGFEEVDISTVQLPAAITAVYRETSGKGYVFEATVKGFADGLVILCGIDADGKIVGSMVSSSNETWNQEGTLDGQYNGQTVDTAELIIAAGATANSATSKGYFAAIEASLQASVIMGGGEVDLRDPAQILNDNCNAALGTEGKTFTKWFAVEALEGVDALYVAEGVDGAVAQIGEVFVGVNADGQAIAGEGIDAEASAKAEAAYAVYAASKLIEIEKPEGADKNVLAVWKTASGNYVFELQAAGYGITGDHYIASGEHIKLMVAISADGKIISTLTTYQNETPNFGDVCATPEYYEQFNGTDADSYASVENVAGATMTTSAYKKAVGLAFTTFELITGGEQ